jgi:drug/metabolite transporter (DMT)-like permease
MTLVFTTLTLICFASNSLLTRLALGGGAIDAASFTSVRMVSGAVMLLAISQSSLRSALSPQPSALREWRLPLVLFGYAITFSFAYVSLTASTGALILFGAVQSTMFTAALMAGERPRALEWSGLVLAFIGLVVLTAPGLAGPSLRGSLSMAASGVCWGFYSLWGRDVKSPLESTTTNFVRVTPLSLLVSFATIGSAHVTTPGALLATACGALTSGVGYVLWYSALAGLSATRAATVQFAAPVIAAAGGVILLAEPVSLRLVASAILILGGIGLAHLSPGSAGA